LTVIAAWLLLPDKDSAPLMERVIMVASILSGGTLGLFCLGFLTRSATRQGCYIGVACCVVFTAWAILTEPRNRVLDLGFNFPLNPILIGICGHAVLFGTGWIASRLFGGDRPVDIERLTCWGLKDAAREPNTGLTNVSKPSVRVSERNASA
jgi:SSS family solute:Na+ symporter